LLTDRVRTYFMWWLNAKFAAGVTAVVLNPAGEVLLLEHAFRRRYPWALPGGWVERHEPLEAAIVREVKEETGLDIAVSHLVSARTFPTHRLDVVFACRLLSDAGAIRPSAETPHWRWCAAGEYPPNVDPYSVELVQLAARQSVVQ
jgi:ADP-ribose pyrophosphatase YjhB (NUDIX family)